MHKDNIYLQSFIIWLIFAILTILFGAFREIIFIPLTSFNPNLARALLLPIAFFYIIGITYIFLNRTKASYSKLVMIKIGVFWLLLTVAFEFGFGGLVMGNSIEKLLADYNLFEGRTWSLFLLCVLLSPSIVNYIFIKKV